MIRRVETAGEVRSVDATRVRAGESKFDSGWLTGIIERSWDQHGAVVRMGESSVAAGRNCFTEFGIFGAAIGRRLFSF
jgi:hypothetical protein